MVVASKAIVPLLLIHVAALSMVMDLPMLMTPAGALKVPVMAAKEPFTSSVVALVASNVPLLLETKLKSFAVVNELLSVIVRLNVLSALKVSILAA